MFTNDPGAQEAKPRRRLRRIVLLIAIVAAGGSAIALGLRAWERRLDPPQGYAHGEQLEAQAVDLAKGAGLAGQAGGHSIEGTVLKTNGQPAFLAMVTAASDGARTTVYAPEGHYRFDGLGPGSYTLLARTPARIGTAAVEIGLAPAAKRAGARKNDKKKPVKTDIPLSTPNPDPDPAAYFAARLKFTSPGTEAEFRMQCTECHQVGSPQTRRGRDKKQWRDVVQRMTAMGATLSSQAAQELPEALVGSDASEKKPVLPLPPYPSHELAGTKIHEWPLGEVNAYIRDLAIAADGTIWAVDMNHDTIHSLDPKTGREQRWDLPGRGHPLGGILRAAARPLGTDLARQAPRSIEYGEDGRLWIACALGNEIVAFDPADAKTKHWSLPRGSFYPNLLRVRGKDVWFTIALTNQLGHVDLATNEVRVVDLPVSHWGQILARKAVGSLLGLAAGAPQTDAQLKYSLSLLTGSGTSYLPMPEGLDIAPDGSIWYSKLYDDRIGRHDPATGTFREWPTPFHGPRQIQLDAQGRVWIPAFGSSLVARFDPATEKFETWALPLLKPLSDRPYSVAVDPRDGRIWIASTTMDVLYRFNPVKSSFEMFPLPTRTAYMRKLVLGPAGEVCASYSNFPEHHRIDAEPKLMCLAAPG